MGTREPRLFADGEPRTVSASTEQTRSGLMRLALLVAQRDYLRTVRRRGYLFGTLLLPLGLGALMAISTFFSAGAAGGGDPSEVTVVVVNESALSIGDWPGQASIDIVDEADARKRLDNGAIAQFFVIPSGFPEGAVTRVQQAADTGLASLGDRDDQEDVLGLLLRLALLREAGLTDSQAVTIMQGVPVETIAADGEPVSDLAVAASIVVPMIFVGLFMISIFITSGYLLQSVTEEKENRVVEIVLSSIPSLPLMAGKVLGLGAAGLTQVLIWVITALIAIPLIGNRVGQLDGIAIDPAVLVLAIVYFVLGYLAYGAIFAAIGAIAPGNREAQQYSGFLGFFAAIPFILFAVFLTDINSVLVVALALFPLTAPTSMLLVLGLSESIPWTLVGASLVSLILFGAIATLASGRIFRATVLLYGVRPSLGQLIAAVRSPH